MMELWQLLASGVGGVLLALLAAFAAGRSSGRKAEEQRRREAERKAYQTREMTDEEIARLDDGPVRDGLREWTRD